MSDPIISPWLIYFLGICEQIKQSSVFLAISGSLAIVIATMALLRLVSDTTDNKTQEKWCQRIILMAITLLIVNISQGFLCESFIPDREWIIAIILADQTTPENIETVVESAEDAYSFVRSEFITLLEEISEKKE